MYDLTEAVWRKSSRSNNNTNCVEVAAGRPSFDGVVGVRDSKDPDGPMLVFQPEDWTAFLAAAHAGDYDIHR